MGRGHFKPTTDNARMRIYDLHDLYAEVWGEDPEAGRELEWETLIEDFEATILNHLPQSFTKPRGINTRPTHHNPYANSDGRVIAYNGHVAIALYFDDSYVYVYAFPVVNGGWTRYDDIPTTLSVHYLHNVLPLHKVWTALPIEGSVRCGSWTSRKCVDSYDENRYYGD